MKTSGSTGIHVLIPLGARYTYDQSRTLAELIARVAVQALPDIATIVRNVSNRGGKVYVDFGQNGHGQLLVSPLCVRPLPGAPVSMPLEWAQINSRLTLGRYTIRTAAKWLRKHGDPLLPVLDQSIDMLAALEALAPLVANGRRAT